MVMYKNLPFKEKRLYKLAYSLGLTEWHWTAARILLRVNGYDNAEGYLKKVKAEDFVIKDVKRKKNVQKGRAEPERIMESRDGDV